MATKPQPTAWLDKVSAEIRIEIFRHLYCRLRLKPQAKRNNTDIALLVALVNDLQKYAEAREVFFHCNIFVLRNRQQLHGLACYQSSPAAMKYLTRLELVNLNDKNEFLNVQSMQSAIQKVSTHLPKLKSLTIAYDPLRYGVTTTREHFDKGVFKDRKLNCVAVGCYTLDCKERYVVQLQHYHLVHCWSEMKKSQRETLASVESQLDYAARSSHRLPLSCFFDSLSLAEWIPLFEAYVAASLGSNSPALSDREQDFLTEFGNLLRIEWKAGKVYDAVGSGTSFRDLDMKLHDPEMLEAISDFLCEKTWEFRNLLETNPGQPSMRLAEGYRKVAVGPSS
ncbi:hypothetical protein LTR17_013498 [Elasticomyces elasticus]|nr:hypothetical protein LTR17_013498 [Elasticomyces elasticus]